MEPPRASQTIEFSGPSAFTPSEVAGVFSRALGKAIKLATLEPPLTRERLRESMKAAGLPSGYAESRAEMYEAINDGRIVFERPNSVARTKTTFDEFATALVGGAS